MGPPPVENRTERTNGDNIRRSRIQLHHDNAAPHIALNTQTYLDDNGIRLMEHPLYLPDLARAISDSFQKLNQPVLGSLF